MEQDSPVGLRHIYSGHLLELKEVHRRVILNDMRKSLMKSLLQSGLCTKDIYSFVCTQADLCETLDSPDWTTVRSAMHNKIRDIQQTLKNEHRQRNKLEKKVLDLYGGRGWKLRQAIKTIKNDIEKEKQMMIQNHRKKLEHYKKNLTRLLPDPSKHQRRGHPISGALNQARVIPTNPPKNLEDFSTISVFGTPEDMTKKKPPLGPYVTNTNIKLSKGEWELLSRNPKYSVKYPPMRMAMATEVERMNAKIRYDKGRRKRKKKLDKWTDKITDVTGDVLENKIEEGKKKIEDMSLEEIFQECRDRLIFDPLMNTVDFSQTKPTDYKLNRSVILPAPLENDKELECELRRSGFMKAFDEYQVEHSDRRILSKGGKSGQMNKTKKKKVNSILDQGKKGVFNKDPLNLTKNEIKAMKTLKDRIKEGELIVSQTDKSSRFAVLSKQQYLESGKVHTSKDKEISWKEVAYLQKQINSHVWWLTKILKYGQKKDPERLLRNLQNHCLEVPDMALLIKDHKQWHPTSGKPVPSRPVVSGNRGVNSHLSEILSEVLEPLVLEMGGGEISSTEEALHVISSTNEKIENGVSLEDINILTDLAADESNDMEKDHPTVINSVVDVTGNGNGDITQVEGEGDLLECLMELFREGVGYSEITSDSNTAPDMGNSEFTNHSKQALDKEDIRTYLIRENRDQPRYDAWKIASDRHKNWLMEEERRLRNTSGCARTFNESLRLRYKATRIWTTLEKDRREELKSLGGTRKLPESLEGEHDMLGHPKSGAQVEMGHTSASIDSQLPPPPLQDKSQRPVFIGGDAVALYPSMDIVGTAEMVAQAVERTKIEFKEVDYASLSIYLFLLIGEEGFRENGLKEYTPERKVWKNSEAKSLTAKINRDINNWCVKTDNLDKSTQRKMFALMIKLATLALMDSTCYSFGGNLYRQLKGAGIGLRASACMAKILMGMIDKTWAATQNLWSLVVAIYIRYIDDLRLLLYPINKGWSWGKGGWVYDANVMDDRDAMTRTKEEIAKTFNDVIKFIEYTTECEGDFHNNFLPTLDFQTQVQEDGRISFKFFSKPMSNNLTIQKGSSLPKNTIFSSLRQDLIRRMLNCDRKLDLNERITVIEDYIQILVNSGHEYKFIKSVILQALTRYKYMLMRSDLDSNHVKYMPLYRARSYQQILRKMNKCVEYMTWYKGLTLYDPHRNGWKKQIKQRRQAGMDLRRSTNKETVSVLFVPPSDGSELMQKIMEVENNLHTRMSWNIKILEQSGTPLALTFIPKFQMLKGCPLSMECRICYNTGVKCAPKGVIYQASCKWCCHSHVEVEGMVDLKRKQDLLSDSVKQRKRGHPISGAEAETGQTSVGLVEVSSVPTVCGTYNSMRPEIGSEKDDINRNVYDVQDAVQSGGEEPVKSCEKHVYIGETSRPFRQRVKEHYQKLKVGNLGSFMLNHWMERHGLSTEPPEFEWKIIAKYKDPLRRQLCEGLHILQSGTLNKKSEFNNNLICRLEAVDNKFLTDKQLKLEIESRRENKDKLREFVNVMTRISDAIVLPSGRGRGKSNVNSNESLSSRYNHSNKRKREAIMDTSTPSHSWRDVAMVSIEDESPIRCNGMDGSCNDSLITSSTDGEQILSNARTGMSNELDSVASIAPYVEPSPETMNKMLWNASSNITGGAKLNNTVAELLEEEIHEQPVGENSFHQQANVGTLSKTPNIWLRRLDLGLNATREILTSKAIDGGRSPKRPLPMVIGTPTKKKRMEMSKDCSNSPILKSHCDEERGLMVRDPKRGHPISGAYATGSEGVGDKDAGQRKKVRGKRTKSRIAASLPGLSQGGGRQLLINDMWSGIDGRVTVAKDEEVNPKEKE